LLFEGEQYVIARREVLQALEEAPRYRDAHRLLLEIVGKMDGPATATAPAAAPRPAPATGPVQATTRPMPQAVPIPSPVSP
jgi:hypothetical protein